tara:strand:+ start:763 stop:1614 length:852 start_codon:yes stop_codon:yes gene_type:complete
MEPSRDDFIIAIRSAFLKKGTKQRFSLLGLLFFSILLIVLGKFNFTAVNYLKLTINEVIYRVSFIASMPERYFRFTSNEINNHVKLYENYNIIKKNLDQLTTEKYRIEFLEQENKRLKKIVEDISFVSEEKIAKVIVDKQSPFLKSIVLNKGSKNNIKKGMAILHDDYLVGKIVEVNYATSRALLLSDLNSKIPIIIEPGSIQSILSGTGENEGLIQYKKDKIPVNNNSIVYTSGAGGLFKAGIPVGKIIFKEDQDRVNFFVDFSQLRFVKILSFKEEQEINK